jgi:hypothetical protein
LGRTAGTFSADSALAIQRRMAERLMPSSVFKSNLGVNRLVAKKSAQFQVWHDTCFTKPASERIWFAPSEPLTA